MSTFLIAVLNSVIASAARLNLSLISGISVASPHEVQYSLSTTLGGMTAGGGGQLI